MRKTFLLVLFATMLTFVPSCTKSDDEPNITSGTEQTTPGTSTDSTEVPADSTEVPADSTTVPSDSTGIPANPSDSTVIPQDSTDVSGNGDQPVVSYAKGADISWVTEMESKNKKFYNKQGVQTECFALMKDLGVNAIRLRVWVNPTGGWNGKADVLEKALRAKEQGLALMIDFHYSDSWADPGKQYIPNVWKGHTLEQLKQDVADHTKDVLQTLKDNDIKVQWVQVGNETNQGMLWDNASVQANNGFAQHQQFSNFIQLINAGYDAVKSVYPDAGVIVHTSNGYDSGLFQWMYDGLKNNGARYDIIGMSLYPENASWQATTNNCLSNIRSCISRYNKPVMVVEVGMPWDASNAASFMKTIVSGTKSIDRCLGVFYWEPQCYGNWNGYSKGAFNNSGRPTSALDAFAD